MARRRRNPRALSPGLASILEQVAPGGHLQTATPITPGSYADFEPALPRNTYTPYVPPRSAAATAAAVNNPPAFALLAPPRPQIAAPTLSPAGRLRSGNPLLSTPELQAAVDTPQTLHEALEAAYRGEPSRIDKQDVLEHYVDPERGTKVAKTINRIAVENQNEDLGEPEDLTNLALLIGGGAGIRAFKTAAAAGDAALTAGAGTSAAGEVAAAGRMAKGVETLGRVASSPLRHPFLTASSPVAAEVPGALAKGDPSRLLHGFAGTGVLAAALGNAGASARSIPGVGLLGAAAGDAIELPAQVLPSAYLTAQAGVKAAQGDDAQAKEMIQAFGDESALGQLLLHQSLGGALGAAAKHPLYAALEGLGVKGAVGRGIETGLRTVGVEAAQKGRLRPDLNIYDKVNEQRGPYSPDFFSRRRQQRSDASNPFLREPGTNGPRDPGAIPATQGQINKYLRSLTDRQIYGGEQARRGNQRAGEGDLIHSAPGRGRLKGKVQDRVASLQLQGLISSDPEAARLDMENMRRDLIAEQPHLLPSERKLNKQLVRDLDRAVKGGPLDTTELIDNFLRLQDPVESGLVAAKQLTPEQIAERKASPYAHRYMDAQYGLSREKQAALEDVLQQMSDTSIPADQRKGLIGKLSSLRAQSQRLGPDGNPLKLEDIHAHMRDPGKGPGFVDPERIGYVNQQRAALEGEQAPPSTSYAPPDQYAQIGNKKFTGAAVRKGTFDASLEGLVNSWKSQRTVVDRLANFSRFVNRVGLKSPDGRAFENSTEARHAIEHPEDFNMQLPDVPGGWVPMRVAPWMGKKELAEAQADVGQNRAKKGGFEDEAMMDQENGGELLEKTLSEALDPGDGPVVLVPKTVADRMGQHFAKLLPAERAMQAVTGAFKGAVLPTSVTWLAGNAFDNLVIRTAGTGITPGDIRSGKAFGKILREELSERDATYAIESINSGGIFGTHKRIQPYRDARQFVGTKIGPLAEGVHKILETPGPREVHRAYTRYRDLVFEYDSKFIEQTGQWGQLSKTARKELGYTRRKWKRAVADGDPAIRDLARGFRDPDTVDRYAKSIERVFGNWGKNGPAERRFLTTWAPFWQWARAATKFAFITLPADHPVLTSLIAASEQMTREERQKLGFAFDSPEPLPGFLQGSIPDPLAPGGVARVSNLSTFGSFGDPLQFYGSNLTPPVVQSFFLAGMGLDWKGDQLTKADGSPMSIQEKAASGFLNTVDSFVPFLNLGKGLIEHGPSRLNPVREYSPESVASQREPRQQISVPVTGSSSGGDSNPFLGGSGSSSEANPFLEGSAAASGGNPFLE